MAPINQTKPALYQSVVESFFRALDRGAIWELTIDGWRSKYCANHEIVLHYRSKLAIDPRTLEQIAAQRVGADLTEV